ncbi:MAG: hypothetical protein IJK98_08700 [Clostridia bacterium]|nr:hypothetical protein [Clostridia bacterium]
MLGKKKCKILREIRQKIAEENDIPFVTEECRYKGDCKGTCPKCESELRYLEQQLEKRRSLGKAVTVSALAVGLAASVAGCRHLPGDYLEGDVPYSETELAGAVMPEETSDPSETPSDGGEEIVLEGDVLYEPDGAYDPAENLTPTVYGPPLTETASDNG